MAEPIIEAIIWLTATRKQLFKQTTKLGVIRFLLEFHESTDAHELRDLVWQVFAQLLDWDANF